MAFTKRGSDNKEHSAESKYLLLDNLHQVVQIVDDASTCFLAGKAMNNIKVIDSPTNDLAVLSIDGRITNIGPTAQLEALIEERDPCAYTLERVDCGGGCVLPGLVDAHTHPIFAGDRVHEFSMKLGGATYMDVHKAGGGIHLSVEKTRQATEQQLLDNFRPIGQQMIKSGTTLLEAKSGYGLDTECELKMLRVLDRINAEGPLEVSATFCGAHAIPNVPKGATEQSQTRLIVDEVIPLLGRLKKEGQLTSLENIDVFCEKGVFELDSTKEILEAGQRVAGLRANFHADELHPLGGAELAENLKATAASHLEEVSPAGIAALAKSKTVAVLLPATAYVLRLTPPPVRQMVEAVVCIALGSDFNPNSFCLSMPTAMNMACVLFRMSMNEALVAATLNAAHSLGRGNSHGAVAVGRVADFVVLNVPNWEHLIYRLGCHEMIISHVVKGGNVVYERQ